MSDDNRCALPLRVAPLEPVLPAGHPFTIAHFQRMYAALEASFSDATAAAVGFNETLRALPLRRLRARQSRGWRRHVRRVKAGVA